MIEDEIKALDRISEVAAEWYHLIDYDRKTTRDQYRAHSSNFRALFWENVRDEYEIYVLCLRELTRDLKELSPLDPPGSVHAKSVAREVAMCRMGVQSLGALHELRYPSLDLENT